ncbi:UDP-N-acetylglucosamine pyrophosphorylase [Candidatus Ruthia magnifica str. Cm (Calyptogena magnifica)]|uniref:Bifunctional protein GlmU n=1 Tax=Ruthia magnifica subsp. Calyptogena magnifica TaxID=413404 RepID=GLMU_RUTMC|nr:bifunctional UDP-N-acetylglucosamine diphosphorylase/glucosamine-1-phosphate N-acetyltransferase GlmU [Candidatus Ruthturnera calyptogenae]A1AXS8.1 RecName: Full=Bifunctional protein GlmU; Includes: RecName: Full=UDP-N-acetylglucosamine pyrophosphorylase; AltName: Full=N-acetylglucosamine-1-phosphate uridyltransferase; Includes: RecName: Full=Glucosamine-1-phosphate N-acetyltransferase [Candidatus Ruthia magnifica str. Cm (Calyptogena magnifica)]ABL02735.1 UDP-N-acetylglucosamine pyrophosphory
MKNIHAIILAAGKGSRMNSSKPKVLQTLSNNTLLGHILSQVKGLCDKVHVVYGFEGNQVQRKINDSNINWVEQTEQLGTGHAVAQAMPHIEDNSISLILYGDVPLIKKSTLADLIHKAQQSGLSLLSVILDNPTGYGRIIRKDKQIQAIVEQKDATNTQLNINEVNTGIMAVHSQLLKQYLSKINSSNAQGELYLTDIIACAITDGQIVSSIISKNKFEIAGVNDKVQLAELERIFQINQATQFMQQGLSLKDPNRFDCRGVFTFGKDCEIDINALIEGEVVLGDNTIIAPNCIIKNSKIGNCISILSNCVIEDCVIEDGATIGPFARIRPNTHIKTYAKIGNFVEVKKSIIGENTNVSHLSYIGDAIIGKNVNISAGVITCNYDGINKHQTIIGDGAFIGSDSQLVAPIKIGKNATIGAGSTITKAAPDNQLSLSRTKQISLKNWQRPTKK